jgi:hypothetical protein
MRASEFITETARTDQATIDDVRRMWDNGDSVKDIGKKLNFSVDKIQYILTTYYPDRQQRYSRLDQDTIDLVKISSDEGKNPAEIATDLNIPVTRVWSILNRFYPERSNKTLYLALALTDDDKKDMVSKFQSGATVHSLADLYSIGPSSVIRLLQDAIGQEAFNNELERRKSSPGFKHPNKITPEILATIRRLYVQGKTFDNIADQIDNIVSSSRICVIMGKQPDYAELRAKRDEKTRKVKHSPVVTTKKTPAGIDGNQHSKGPGSKHTYGMFPSSKWGMYKP